MQGMISYRAVIDPSDCDFLGHMNVSRYFAACSDGVFALQCALGLTADDMRTGRRMSFAVVNAQSDFRAELSAGEAVHLETAVMEIGGKSMTFRHRLFRSADDVLTFESLFKCVLMSLETRRAVPVPDDIRSRAEALGAD